MSPSFHIRVVCNQKSHSSRGAVVARFTYDPEQPDQVNLGQDQTLIGNERVPNGAARGGADGSRGALEDEFGARGRTRVHVECPLCGLSVTLRHETALKLTRALVASPHVDWRDWTVREGQETYHLGRVSDVELSALAASIG